MNSSLLLSSLAVVSLGACAHAELTGDEHRAAATAAEQKAVTEQSNYNPNAVATRMSPTRGSPRAPELDVGPDGPRRYNPTAGRLLEADRQNKKAFEHRKAAVQLADYEDAACRGVPAAERTSCPLLAPHIAAVEEGPRGVTLVLTSTTPADRLAAQLRCHLAFAKATDFDRVPCPLFMKGVTIDLRPGQRLEVFSEDVKVARQIRAEARRMFGEEGEPVSRR